MSYFNQDFIAFFQELSQNNNKEWFHGNKLRYKKSVKKPFEIFISDLIHQIQKYDPSTQLEAKDCILRINKDIRFSKDKSPYNLHYTAFVSSGGRKDKSLPGLFLRFSPEALYIMAGCFGPDKDQLQNIRRSIAAHPDEFKKIVSEKELVKAFGSVQGEVNKKVPLPFQEALKTEPLIANKQYYLLAQQPIELIMTDSLLDEMMYYWEISRPFNEYLFNAIQSNFIIEEHGI